jgi:cell division septal protein FtsQ
MSQNADAVRTLTPRVQISTARILLLLLLLLLLVVVVVVVVVVLISMVISTVVLVDGDTPLAVSRRTWSQPLTIWASI